MNAFGKKDLEMIQNVTANYFFWQGLRWVPLGFALLIIGLSYTAWWPLSGVWREGLPFAILLAALFLSNAIGTYYARAFGNAQAIPGMHARRETLKWFFFYPVMGASLIVDGVFRPPLFISGFIWAAGLLAYWWSTGRGRKHYVVLTIIFFTLTFIPYFRLVAPGRDMLQLFLIVLGVTFIVGGILDHRELSRILGPVKGEEDE